MLRKTYSIILLLCAVSVAFGETKEYTVLGEQKIKAKVHDGMPLPASKGSAVSGPTPSRVNVIDLEPLGTRAESTSRFSRVLLRATPSPGCYLRREGASHSLWINPRTGVVEASQGTRR